MNQLFVARCLIVVTFVAATRSTLITFGHARDLTFEAAEYKGGKARQHPRYHAFRGAMLALGASTVQALVLLLAPVEDLNPTMFVAQCILALGHYGGWYLPYVLPVGFLRGKPLRAPHWNAEVGHLTAMTTNIAALILARGAYFG